MNKSVAIVGAGISGLSCAYLLSKNNFNVQVFAQSFSPDITSNRAAAFWFPYHVRNDKRGISWAKKSYAFYQQLAHDATTGISIKKLLKVLRSNTVEDEPVWIEFIPKGACKKIPEENLEQGIAEAYSVDVPLIETQIFLPYLRKELENKNVSFKKRTVNNLNELTSLFDIVVNCSGLGARELCNDENIYPVRGQVALIETDTSKPVYLDNETPLYIVPRKDAMIVGGTYEEHVYEEKTEPSAIEKILTTAYSFFPELKEKKVIGSWAGLRPFRKQVRLEQEAGTNIIHNYGHGGSGFTLAFGCADDVLHLAQTINNNI